MHADLVEAERTRPVAGAAAGTVQPRRAGLGGRHGGRAPADPAALAGVDAALRSGGELTEPVERLSAVVLDHLAHEEREVLPLLEQHLSQTQWRTFLHKKRSRRTPRERPEFLTWVLDDAGEQDATAVLAEMPPPARLVYRRVLKARYDAQHRWQIPRPTAEP